MLENRCVHCLAHLRHAGDIFFVNWRLHAGQVVLFQAANEGNGLIDIPGCVGVELQIQVVPTDLAEELDACFVKVNVAAYFELEGVKALLQFLLNLGRHGLRIANVSHPRNPNALAQVSAGQRSSRSPVGLAGNVIAGGVNRTVYESALVYFQRKPFQIGLGCGLRAGS